jgi:transcription antitermination factor NusG
MSRGGSFKRGWYLIYTMPKHEKKVHARLVNLAMNAFLPSRKTLRSWNGRKKYIDEPLFPSYVFVHLEDHHGYWKAMSVPGCISYVRFGKELACVSEQVVDSIRLAIGHEGELHVSDRVFAEGRRVVLSVGRWGHIPCELIEYNNTECVIVRVAPLPHSLLLEIPENNLVKI